MASSLLHLLDELGHITNWTDSAQRMHNLLPNLALRQHVGLLMDDTHPGQQTPVLAQLIRQAIDNGQTKLTAGKPARAKPPFGPTPRSRRCATTMAACKVCQSSPRT